MSSTEGMLSILFVAVAGSSRLFERLGGAEALYAVDRCMKRIARGVDGFRGRIVRKTRDEVTALFANADDACQAAIACSWAVIRAARSRFAIAARRAITRRSSGEASTSYSAISAPMVLS
jgi:class 3 adenylate cyclase